MHWKVSWKELGGGSIEVEAEDRWGAVTKAAGVLGLDKVYPMQFLFNRASVRKPGTSESMGRRKEEVEEEAQKVREEKLDEIKRRYKEELVDLVGGKCEICGGVSILVKHHWEEDGEVKSKEVCKDCSGLLGLERVLEVFREYPPFEVQKFYAISIKEFTQGLTSGKLSIKENFVGFLRRRGRELGVDIEPWLRKGSSTKRVSKVRENRKEGKDEVSS